MRTSWKSTTLSASLLCSLLVGGLAGQALARSPEGYTLKCRDGGFSISLPTKPRAEVKRIETQWGGGEMGMYMSESPNVLYGVGYCNLDREFNDSLDNVLDAELASTIETWEGELVSQNNVTCGDYEGRQFMLSLPNGETLCGIILVSGNREINLIAITSDMDAYGDEVDAFAGSFRLL